MHSLPLQDMDRIESEKANKAAETFSTIYYDTLDKRRSVSSLISDNCPMLSICIYVIGVYGD